MAPSNGSRAPVTHNAHAGVKNNSDPREFYPFCSAGDFSGGGRSYYPSAEEAVKDPDMVAHLENVG